jgi:hypothetical protein
MARRRNEDEESSNGKEEAEFHDVNNVVWDEASKAREPKEDTPQTKFTHGGTRQPQHNN